MADARLKSVLNLLFVVNRNVHSKRAQKSGEFGISYLCTFLLAIDVKCSNESLVVEGKLGLRHATFGSFI